MVVKMNLTRKRKKNKKKSMVQDLDIDSRNIFSRRISSIFLQHQYIRGKHDSVCKPFNEENSVNYEIVTIKLHPL